METQRNYDVRAAERVFRKIVHPGLDSMRLVDRNGIAISSAPGYGLRQKSFIISPRGVPTRISNHVYSGYHSHYSRYDGTLGNESPEMFITQSGAVSARVRQFNNSPSLPSKKRLVSSKSTFRALHMTKSASTDRYLGNTSRDKRQLKSAQTDQEQRLDKEWTNMANCRALKRSSEIVSHRVDRMYYMSGNSIKLQPRYQVDEDELAQLRELSKSRQSSRQRGSRISHQTLTSSRTTKPVKAPLENGKAPAPVEKSSKARSDSGIPNNGRFQVRRDSSDSKSLQLAGGGQPTELKTMGRKSPLQGWASDVGGEDPPLQKELIRKESLHDEKSLAKNFEDDDDETLNKHRADGRHSTECGNQFNENSTDIKQEMEVVESKDNKGVVSPSEHVFSEDNIDDNMSESKNGNNGGQKDDDDGQKESANNADEQQEETEDDKGKAQNDEIKETNIGEKNEKVQEEDG